jgi:hypothetical protein
MVPSALTWEATARVPNCTAASCLRRLAEPDERQGEHARANNPSAPCRARLERVPEAFHLGLRRGAATIRAAWRRQTAAGVPRRRPGQAGRRRRRRPAAGGGISCAGGGTEAVDLAAGQQEGADAVGLGVVPVEGDRRRAHRLHVREPAVGGDAGGERGPRAVHHGGEAARGRARPRSRPRPARSSKSPCRSSPASGNSPGRAGSSARSRRPAAARRPGPPSPGIAATKRGRAGWSAGRYWSIRTRPPSTQPLPRLQKTLRPFFSRRSK